MGSQLIRQEVSPAANEEEVGSLSREKENEAIRREMLDSIRRQLAASAPHDAVRAGHHSLTQSFVGDYTSTSSNGNAQSPVAEFRQALEAVVGECVVVNNEADAARAIDAIIAETNTMRVAISDSPLVRRVSAHMKTSATLDENVRSDELFEYEIGITSAQWGVAETGTLVLESESEKHRFASLIPRIHIAILQATSIRRTLSDVLSKLGDAGRDGLSRTVTFITGPSRTSDIELTLAIGVHGPQHLHVIVIDERPSL